MERIKNYAIILFLCLVFLLQGCLKVDEENFYSPLHTGEATFTETGVTFDATIDKKVAQNAREFGVEYKFVYSDDDSDMWKRIACSRVLQNNDFSAHLSLSELEKNKKNQKGELLSQVKYVAYCDFSGSQEIAEERTIPIVLYLLTTKPNNSNYGVVTSSGDYYISNTEVSITATPKKNYYFTGWSDSDSRELTRTITITSDTTITAIFSEKPYLTAKPNNSDYGMVTGSGLYEVGTKVTITATPKENYYFTGWSDSDSRELTRTITITSDTTITAIFTEVPYLTAKPNNSNYGTVTGSGHYAVGSEAT
ncbi:MAG: InlB B-repeat-containing protein, partial [Paludibacteraceae bacterium]|nr:InlB B-repeat-containing protein [Paludibacteraceae bacterium]